jgi:hypothetical protein
MPFSFTVGAISWFKYLFEDKTIFFTINVIQMTLEAAEFLKLLNIRAK